MTRLSRAIRFPRASFISLCLLGTLIALPAQAFVVPQAAPDAQTVTQAVMGEETSIDRTTPVDLNAATPANLAPVADADPPPSVETPLHRLYCVEYARVRSGFQIFGDAKTWWHKAKHFYAEIATPAAQTVMVFAGSHRISKGHVAVVTKVVSPREIRVDQANWENRGEIDRNTPIMDVSPNNDWSEVRVWDMRSGQFGTHIYAIKGFIARLLPTTVSDSDDP
jgi:hypothetical protein